MIDQQDVMYYSANGEDYLLWQFFDYKPQGTYLDIGAFDGIHFSNTYSFESRGWQGVCVEPNPRFFPYLQQNRPAATCLHMACVGHQSTREVTLFSEELGLLSTTCKTTGYEQFVAERYRRRGLPFSGLQPVSVPATTINEILARYFAPHPPLDIVSIDVEGAELEVLQGFDLQHHRPRVVVIESNHAAQTQQMIAYFVGTHGYIHAGTLMENLFFVRTQADKAKLRDIPIQCNIQPQMHPLGPHFTPQPYQKGVVLNHPKKSRLQ